MQFCKFFIALAVLALFSACRDLTPPTELESGLEGQVYNLSHPGPIPIGWVAPSMQAVVTVIVLNDDKQVTAETLTDAQGKFFVALAPGTYFLSVKESPVPIESGPFKLLHHQRLTVEAFFDNGMR